MTMTHRDRLLAAIRREPTDRIAVDVMTIENADAVAAYLGIAPEAVYDRLGIDGRGIWTGPYLGVCASGEDLSEWGTPNDQHYGTVRRSPLAGVESVAAVERYPWPDPLAYAYADIAVRAASLSAAYAVRGPGWNPQFCRVCDLFGMEEAMTLMLTAPAVFEAALEAVYAFTEIHCTRLLDACGEHLAIFNLGDDFATQRGLMIDPAHWRRFLKPRLRQLFALGKSRGKYIWFHSCGDITSVLPDLIDMGMDVWETVQLHTLPLSPAALKREYGAHLTFFGGVNTQRLPFATPAEVARETRHSIEALGPTGYIVGPDHHVKPDVPPENVVALYDAAINS